MSHVQGKQRAFDSIIFLFFSALLQGNILSSLHLTQLPAVTKKVVLTKEILIYDKVGNSQTLTFIITGQMHLGSTGLNRRA